MKRVASQRGDYDAVIVGAGPNGLSAAVALARAGVSTLVVEAKATPGGGARSEALTLPGFVHDVCSTVHPLGIGSPFFRTLPLGEYGLEWVQPSAPLGHMLADGEVVLLERSIEETARELGEDGEAYARLIEPFVGKFDELMRMLLGPVRVPSSPALLARFGLSGLGSLRSLVQRRFRHPRVAALLAGVAAHAMVPLEWLGTASFALVLAVAGHAVGWPFAGGGSRAITQALTRYFESLGGELVLDEEVEQLEQLPRARAYLLDVTPRQVLELAGTRLTGSYARRLSKYRYGPGVYKMDFALRAPIPWRDPRALRAGTIHLAGDLEEVARAEAEVQAGALAHKPFVLVVQSSLFDPTRAPSGMHTAWAYCHVPNASAVDAADAIEERIERFAPGFREQVIARYARGARAMERYNANYVGGDINGGRADFGQLLFRPVVRVDPYATPIPDLFLCSSSTPPGGGVHGMCGYWAAQSVLRRVFGRAATP